MTESLCFPDEGRIGREILGYLLDHPDAEDTVDGIVQWWLLDRKIRYQTTLVKETLADLVNRGLILESGGGHAGHRYQLNHQRRQEISSLLGEGSR